MAFNSIPQAWINSGAFVIQSLMQYIKDNFDSLNSSVVGVGASDVPNGSFEIDSDSNGVPDTWTQNLYPGGAAVLDATTQAKAGKSLKLTSPGGAGNGGAYYDSDYVPCNEGAMVNLAFSHKSSVAGIHNQVILVWYTSARTSPISSTTIYNDATTNPTSWTRFIRGAAPVSTARYFKVRLDGANSDDATAGSAWFDDVGTVGGVNTVAGYTTGENATSTAGFDRIYIAGVLASTTGNLAPSGVATGIAGGSVAITARTGAAVQGTLTLVLPEGKWSIFVTTENVFVSADPDLFHHKINAIAFREG